MKTVFLRVLEAEDKAAALLDGIREPERTLGRRRFDVEAASFAAVPRSPFAYWVSDRIRRLFNELPPFEAAGRTAKCGAGTLDDFRFLRLGSEVPRSSGPWVPFAKGGAFGRFYADVYLRLAWADGGAEIQCFVEAKVGSATRKIQAQSWYLRPGLTWPRRTQGGLSLRAMPAGCIFADKGPAAFVENDDTDELLALLAAANSSAFNAMVDMQMAFGSYEVGVLQRTPVPPFTDVSRSTLARLARCAWSLSRSLDTRTETSHAFTLPSLLQVVGTHVAARGVAWSEHVCAVAEELAGTQAEIDERCFALYGIDETDRRAIAEGFGGSTTEADLEVEPGDRVDDDEADDTADAESLTAELASWAVGVAFGRFDVRLATGARLLPIDPEPFDPLPVCSPGMLTGDDGLPAPKPPEGYPLRFPDDGLLVDDPGHQRDLDAAVRAVFDIAFGADADARWSEAAALLDSTAHDPRTWLAKDFFEHHVKRYSKSRRKAPIYWQLGTASGSYAVWLYAHRIGQDTFFRVQNDFVAPRLAHEERRLDGLRADAQANPTPALRKELAASEALVEDLRTMLAEVKRIAPLWKPDLDDGVVITMAPLWRLVPQHPGWQRELKSTWDTLCKGDYDWAHLAMHLWPARVVPKCSDDRSLAIAHGLEDHLWVEDFDGRWRKRRDPKEDYQHVLDHFTTLAKTKLLRDIEAFWRTTFHDRRRTEKQWWLELESGGHDVHSLALQLWPDRVLLAAWDDESLAREHDLRVPRADDGDIEARDRWVKAQLKKHPPALNALDLGLVASFLGDLDGEAGWAERWARLWNGDFDRTHRVALLVRPAEVVPLAHDEVAVARVHGLDRWFWIDDGDEGHRHVESPEDEVARAIASRRSDAVKAALDDLLSAPVTGVARGRGKGRRSSGGS